MLREVLKVVAVLVYAVAAIVIIFRDTFSDHPCEEEERPNDDVETVCDTCAHLVRKTAACRGGHHYTCDLLPTVFDTPPEYCRDCKPRHDTRREPTSYIRGAMYPCYVREINKDFEVLEDGTVRRVVYAEIETQFGNWLIKIPYDKWGG